MDRGLGDRFGLVEVHRVGQHDTQFNAWVFLHRREDSVHGKPGGKSIGVRLIEDIEALVGCDLETHGREFDVDRGVKEAVYSPSIKAYIEASRLQHNRHGSEAVVRNLESACGFNLVLYDYRLNGLGRRRYAPEEREDESCAQGDDNLSPRALQGDNVRRIKWRSPEL